MPFPSSLICMALVFKILLDFRVGLVGPPWFDVDPFPQVSFTFLFANDMSFLISGTNLNEIIGILKYELQKYAISLE